MTIYLLFKTIVSYSSYQLRLLVPLYSSRSGKQPPNLTPLAPPPLATAVLGFSFEQFWISNDNNYCKSNYRGGEL